MGISRRVARSALALGLREIALAGGWLWLGAAWVRLLLLGAALALAIVPALDYVLGIASAGPLGLAVLLAIAGATLAAHARLLPDRHAVVMAVAALALTAAAAGGRAEVEAIGFADGSTLQTVASLALLMPWLLLVFLAAAAAVKRMRARIAAPQAG